MASSDEGYGTICKPEAGLACDYYLSPRSEQPTSNQDMDLGLFTDQLLPSEWTPLFEGQLSELEPMLDPSTGAAGSLPATSISRGIMTASGLTLLESASSMKLLEETQRLERQQKLQQQKLFELQQTLLKTEILKNQLQIASISKNQGVNTTTSLFSALRNTEASMATVSTSRAPPQQQSSMTTMATSRTQPQQQSVSTSSYELLAEGSGGGGLRELLPSRALQQPARSLSPSILAPELLQDDNDDIPEPDRRKVHNLIEKKYRTSINDRIGTLREIVARHTRDNKRLQKSAVLQKTIDYIRYLEKNVKILHEENQQLRQTLGKAPAAKLSLALGSAPSTPPSQQISPHQSESEQDSGHPSSPEDIFTEACTQEYKYSLLACLASSANGRPSAASHGLLCVLAAVLFFVGPLSLTKGWGHPVQPHAGSRVLSGLGPGDQTSGLDSVVYWTYWGVWLLVAMVCYGLVTLRALPRASAKSASKFWQHRGQAEKHLQMGHLLKAHDSIEMVLADIGRPLPNSYFSLCVEMCWSILQHVLFQAMIGQWAVALASYLVKKPQQTEVGSKKERFGVTAADIAETYHFLHKVNMALSGGNALKGIGFYVGTNAINFANLDAPFGLLRSGHLAEMYLTQALQCHFSAPHWSCPLMWYYFHCSRGSGLALPHKWMVTPQGRRFLMGTSWALEVTSAPRLYHGVAALPMCSITRAYSRQLLYEGFTLLLLPENSSLQGAELGEAALTTLQQVHHLAEEAQAMLCANIKSLGTVLDTSDSGFDVIEWWASIGLVACYWYMGKDSLAQEHYASIDGISGDSSPVRTALYQSFMAARLHHPTSKDVQPPVEHLLQLCTLTSDILKTCVREALQENSNTAEGGLHQLGLLLACEWLLQLRTSIWEEHSHEEGVRRSVVQSFAQDVDTMAHLIKLLPEAIPKLHLYKGFQSSISGANPLHTQLLLSSTGRSASLRRRRHQAKEAGNGCGSLVTFPEQAMAKVFAYKHLPRSLEVPGGTTGGDMLMMCCHDTGQVISQTVSSSKAQGPTQTAV